MTCMAYIVLHPYYIKIYYTMSCCSLCLYDDVRNLKPRCCQNPRYTVVLINGGALGIDWIKEHSPAVLEAFYGGEAGGQGIVDVLDGSYSPTGKLPYTIYNAAFNTTRPITDMSLRGGQGITHLHYEGKPLWPFGSGLSYTEWSLALLESSAEAGLDWGGHNVTAQNLRANDAPPLRIRVTNAGAVAAAMRVLGFVTCGSDTDERLSSFPRQRLFGFAAVPTLAPGAAAVVEIAAPTARQLSIADATGRQW
jgi:beta-glucosidase